MGVLCNGNHMSLLQLAKCVRIRIVSPLGMFLVRKPMTQDISGSIKSLIGRYLNPAITYFHRKVRNGLLKGTVMGNGVIVHCSQNANWVWVKNVRTSGLMNGSYNSCVRYYQSHNRQHPVQCKLSVIRWTDGLVRASLTYTILNIILYNLVYSIHSTCVLVGLCKSYADSIPSLSVCCTYIEAVYLLPKSLLCYSY